MDFTELLGAISLGTVTAALMAVAGIKVVPIAARWGISRILGMIGR